MQTRSAPAPPLLPDDRFATSVIRDLLVHARRPDVISLAGGLPATELLPTERLALAADAALRGPAATRMLQYGTTRGEPELIDSLAARDPAGTGPDHFCVTTGSQQALDLVVRSLSRPGDRVAIEDPGYIGALQTMRTNGLTLQGVPVDAHGLDVDALEAIIETGGPPRLCYVNPNFQNPTGAVLDPERATRLVELAERHDFIVIADDPYREISFDASPIDLPPSTHVVRLRSTSKTLAPGLRVGWLQADPAIIERVAMAKQSADLHTPILGQHVVAALLDDNTWWQAHVAALRSGYRQRRDALATALEQAGAAGFHRPGGGFFLWLDDMVDSLDAALDRGVAFVPGSAFAVDRDLSGTARLSFSSVPTDRIGEAVARLTPP